MNRSRRILISCLLALLLAAALWIGRVQAGLLLRLLAGGAAISYLFHPLSCWLSRRLRLSRSASIILAFAAAGGVMTLFGSLLLPPLVQQMRELITAAPSFADSIKSRMQAMGSRLTKHGFSLPALSAFNWEGVFSSLPPLLGGTASIASTLISRITEGTLCFLLAYYFLRDRERMALHMELLIPCAFRRTALRMAAAVHREIGAFLRGQAVISLIVAAMSALALLISGVHAFLALGLIVGIFNMIPYFGPILGAIPAVLMALTQSPGHALAAGLSLLAVQQLDSLFISPRVMGALTGLHPAAVLLAITLGSSFSGIAGMLLAIPFLLTVRAVSRVWIAERIGN